VKHGPVHIAFTTSIGKDTAANVLATGEFVVNLPRWEQTVLEKVRIAGLPFAPGVNELEKAGLAALPSVLVKPPRILECPRHFECKVQWTKEWTGQLMVVGEVVAASVDADCVDEQGYVLWERVKSAHYCGAPYKGLFVAAYQTMAAGRPYEGPEVEMYESNEDEMLRKV
jgi:flavin reductase (DIM6/NTAB) family NADH-FMN oxidoreductase RutF